MKFYNPFKAHVIHLATNMYYIRRFGVLGWEYLDRKDYYWWTNKNHWNDYPTLQAALDRALYNPNKIVKVYQ